MRLIDADRLLTERMKSMYYHLKNGDIAIPIIDIENAPTVDAEPIRHGRWVDQYDDGNWHCSICGAIVEKDEQDRHNWYRCYHCGARMDEVKE